MEIKTNNCDKCKSTLVAINGFSFIKMKYCPNFCASNFYRNFHSCEKDFLVKKGTTIRHQCKTCGKLVGNALSTKDYDINILDDFSLLYHKFEEQRNHESLKSNNIQERYAEKVRENHNSFKSQWWEKYNLYLKSEEWKNKRKLVFKRDKNICQSCLVNDAQQVHHLSYKHVTEEPLYHLISICNVCHERVTKKDRNTDYKFDVFFDSLQREYSNY